MAKKFINGENLVYAMGEFEKKMKEMVEAVTDIMEATESEIRGLFGTTDASSTSIETE